MIIVSVNGVEVGIIVDAASDVIDLPVDSIEPNPEVVGSAAVDYIDGVVKINDRLIILLNLEKVLISEQHQLTVKAEG